jgi:hypothetical protein
MKRELTVIIERDEDGYFVGTVPELLFGKKHLISSQPVGREYETTELSRCKVISLPLW